MFARQFEGGLYTTALVIDGAYQLATAAKKAPTLSEVKMSSIQIKSMFLLVVNIFEHSQILILLKRI